MRVEDLQRIQQNQITSNTLLYASNNGTPYSATFIDIASQVSGVTGTYVINSQLNSVSGALATQIVSTSGYVTNNSVFVTGNQLIAGNKSISGYLKILNSPTTINTNGTLYSYENALSTGDNFYVVGKSSRNGSITNFGFFPTNSSGVTDFNWGISFDSTNYTYFRGYQGNGSIFIDPVGNINLDGNSVACAGMTFTAVDTIQGDFAGSFNLGNLQDISSNISFKVINP